MLHLTPFLTAYSTIMAFILGTVMASFLGCMGWRMCKGHCRHYGASISRLNLYGEVGMGVLFALLTLQSGNVYFVVTTLFFFCILYLVTLTDIYEQIIPDSALLVAIVVRVIGFLLNYKYDFYTPIVYIEKPALKSELLGLLIDGLAVTLPLLILVLIMEKILKKEVMGGGDIKLLFVTGLYLGWAKNILVVFFACIIGIISAAIQQRCAEKVVKENASKNEMVETEEQPFCFTFGPPIAASAVFVTFFGNQILDRYLSIR